MRIRGLLSLIVVVMVASASWAAGAPRAQQRASGSTRAFNPAVTGKYASVTGITPLDSACGDPDPSVVLARLQLAKQTGVTRVRCDLTWWTVQPTGPTSWTWTMYDNVVSGAASAGLSVLFVPDFTPPWARPNPLPPGTINPSHVPPASTTDYTNFLTAAVRRYSPIGTQRPAGLTGSVRQWEIWNEPNIVGFWNPTNATAYATFLKASATAIKSADAAATVISGGMAPAADGNGNFSPMTGLKAIVATGAIAKIDGFAIHPYSFPAFASENVAANPILNLVPKLAQYLAQTGHAGKKIWATELGWPTASQSPRAIRSDGTVVGTESYQAFEMVDLLHTWFAGRSYAGPVILYTERDRCTDNTSWLCMMGIERLDGTHKPAYATLLNELQRAIGT